MFISTALSAWLAQTCLKLTIYCFIGDFLYSFYSFLLFITSQDKLKGYWGIVISTVQAWIVQISHSNTSSKMSLNRFAHSLSLTYNYYCGKQMAKKHNKYQQI